MVEEASEKPDGSVISEFCEEAFCSFSLGSGDISGLLLDWEGRDSVDADLRMGLG